MTISIEDKYKWLCDKLHITDIDYWEQDAFLNISPGWESGIYFQFSANAYPETVDEAVELCMTDWYRNRESDK